MRKKSYALNEEISGPLPRRQAYDKITPYEVKSRKSAPFQTYALSYCALWGYTLKWAP